MLLAPHLLGQLPHRSKAFGGRGRSPKSPLQLVVVTGLDPPTSPSPPPLCGSLAAIHATTIALRGASLEHASACFRRRRAGAIETDGPGAKYADRTGSTLQTGNSIQRVCMDLNNKRCDREGWKQHGLLDPDAVPVPG